MPATPSPEVALPHGIERQLVLEFFFVFSRLESALKRAGYFKPGMQWPEPDWKRFGSDIEHSFSPQTVASVMEAVQYLQLHPPRQQVVRNGSIVWESPSGGSSSSMLPSLLHHAKTVRNNLFHGGKYPGGPIPEPSRQTQLLRSVLVLLRECIRLHPEVRRHFHEALS